MRLLDRLIIREYLRALIAIAFIITLLVLVSIILEHIDDVVESGASMSTTSKWILLQLPYKIVQTFPVIIMLAVLFSIGGLSRHNEIIAIVSMGISRSRIFVPILFVTIGLTAFTYWFSEVVVPRCNLAAEYVERVEIEHKPPPTEGRSIFLRGAGDTYYWMDAYHDYANRQRMINPVVLRLSPDRTHFVERIEAKWATHIQPHRPGSTPHWRFHAGAQWTFSDDGEALEVQRFRERRYDLEDDLSEFLSVRKRPEEMNYLELKRYIEIVSQRPGIDLDQFETEMHLKIAFPLALIIIAMISFPFAMKTRSGSLFVGFSLALLCIIGYYGFVAVLRSLGHEGHLWPWFAAWSPNAVFLIAASYFMGLWRT